MLPNVQARLSITPISFLCSISTHSTAGTNKKRPPHLRRSGNVESISAQWKHGLTENRGDDDDARDTKPGEEPQHHEHHVGGGKSTGNSEEHAGDVRHQKHGSAAEPSEGQRERQKDRFYSSGTSKKRRYCKAEILVAQTSEQKGADHHSHKKDGGSCFVLPSLITHQVPLMQEERRETVISPDRFLSMFQ